MTVADWAVSSAVGISALFYGYSRGYREGWADGWTKGATDGHKKACEAAQERHDRELEKVADWLLQGGVR